MAYAFNKVSSGFCSTWRESVIKHQIRFFGPRKNNFTLDGIVTSFYLPKLLSFFGTSRYFAQVLSPTNVNTDYLHGDPRDPLLIS